MQQNGRINWLYSTISKALPTKISNFKGFMKKAEEAQTPDKSEIINFESHDPMYFTKLVAYCSDQVKEEG